VVGFPDYYYYNFQNYFDLVVETVESEITENLIYYFRLLTVYFGASSPVFQILSAQ
jgi:hypothetical protein